MYLKLDDKFPCAVYSINQKLKSLKKDTSEDQSCLLNRTPSYEIDRHDSVTNLYGPVDTNEYTLQGRDNTVPITVVDVCST